MTTIFDSAGRVKLTRPFGQGLATRPERRMPYTAADLRWNAENSPANAIGYEVEPEPDYDRLAGEFEAQARLDMGWCL